VIPAQGRVGRASYLEPAEKVNITVPSRVLSRMDAYAKRQSESRSGIPVCAAQQAMKV